MSRGDSVRLQMSSLCPGVTVRLQMLSLCPGVDLTDYKCHPYVLE